MSAMSLRLRSRSSATRMRAPLVFAAGSDGIAPRRRVPARPVPPHPGPAGEAGWQPRPSGRLQRDIDRPLPSGSPTHRRTSVSDRSTRVTQWRLTVAPLGGPLHLTRQARAHLVDEVEIIGVKRTRCRVGDHEDATRLAAGGTDRDAEPALVAHLLARARRERAGRPIRGPFRPNALASVVASERSASNRPDIAGTADKDGVLVGERPEEGGARAQGTTGKAGRALRRRRVSTRLCSRARHGPDQQPQSGDLCFRPACPISQLDSAGPESLGPKPIV